MKPDAGKLKQYLLANLSDEETAAIDLQFFDDPGLESELTSAEENLIEDYIDETLDRDERKLFERNFLISARRREHLAFTADLKRQVDALPTTAAKTEDQPSLLERLTKIFRPKFPQIVVFASALVIAAVFGWWLLGAGERSSEIAALNRQDLSDLTTFQKTSKLTLTGEVLRGGGSNKILEKDLLTENVFLQINLRENADTIPRLRIYRNDNLLETLGNVRVYKTDGGAEIRLLLPAAKLEKGAYRVEFEIENRKTSYDFSVR